MTISDPPPAVYKLKRAMRDSGTTAGDWIDARPKTVGNGRDRGERGCPGDGAHPIVHPGSHARFSRGRCRRAGPDRADHHGLSPTGLERWHLSNAPGPSGGECTRSRRPSPTPMPPRFRGGTDFIPRPSRTTACRWVCARETARTAGRPASSSIAWSVTAVRSAARATSAWGTRHWTFAACSRR